MRYSLDTNIVSDLVRHPQGRVAAHIRRVGEAAVAASVVVAAELRYRAQKKRSARLTAQLEAVLGALAILSFEPPADATYAIMRARLERLGKPVGGNDLLIAAHAVALGLTIVTDNVAEFGQVEGLSVENWVR
jgi:tRNA(fMet)-specific endonuclease VapC